MRPLIKSWGSRVDLADERETGPSLSLPLLPDHEILKPTSGACLCASSDRAKETSSREEMDFKCFTSERQSGCQDTRLGEAFYDSQGG